MEFFDVVRMRRSVRQFTPEPVGRDVLERIVAAGVEAPSGCNLQLRQYVIVDDPAVLAELRAVSKALSSAPAAIVVLIEPTASKFGEFYIQDAAAAIENMLLAAVALGYASCWVEGQVYRHADRLGKLLGVPEPFRVRAILPVGRGASRPPRPPKPSAADVTHYNRYGGSGG